MAGTRRTKKAGRVKSCTSKKSFRTEAGAIAYRLWRISQGAAEWTCQVYRCKRFCGGFHVGHRPAVKYRARAGR